MGVYYELGTLRISLKKIPCLHSLRSWAIYFAFARLRLAKIIFFRGLIKFLAHNHLHITTISIQQAAHNGHTCMGGWEEIRISF